jgi:purine nucleoside permease
MKALLYILLMCLPMMVACSTDQPRIETSGQEPTRPGDGDSSTDTPDDGEEDDDAAADEMFFANAMARYQSDRVAISFDTAGTIVLVANDCQSATFESLLTGDKALLVFAGDIRSLKSGDRVEVAENDLAMAAEVVAVQHTSEASWLKLSSAYGVVRVVLDDIIE